MSYNDIYELSRSKADHTVWVMSDLQQSRAELTERCLNTAMDDYISYLKKPAEMVWYLGDAVEGEDKSHLEAMTRLQTGAFEKLGIPLCYTCGNHDFDFSEKHRDEPPLVNFAEAVRAHPGWHTTASCEDLYFKVSLGSWEVYFLSDHAAKDNSWCVTHGRLRWGGIESYPYTRADTDRLRNEITSCGKNVITASHYAFMGGNRENALQSEVLPLHDKVRVHFYGHSHIGDLQWGARMYTAGYHGLIITTYLSLMFPVLKIFGAKPAARLFFTCIRAVAAVFFGVTTMNTALQRHIFRQTGNIPSRFRGVKTADLVYITDAMYLFIVSMASMSE
jgi:predicted phosphodiesterase